jgi:hypothetical protein
VQEKEEYKKKLYELKKEYEQYKYKYEEYKKWYEYWKNKYEEVGQACCVVSVAVHTTQESCCCGHQARVHAAIVMHQTMQCIPTYIA